MPFAPWQVCHSANGGFTFKTLNFCNLLHMFFEYILICCPSCCPKELDNNDEARHINHSSMQRPASSPKGERYAFVHLLNISQTGCADVAATLFLRLFEAAFSFSARLYYSTIITTSQERRFGII
jgi:hypothetical protein